MAETAVRHSIFALALTGLLAGCVETGGGGGLTPFSPAASAKPGGDVEAPEVFQVTDTALWDGRPSLGGIWVASPDAVDPERVLMENITTGLTVEGALFRRERDNPGPALQISSDAAEALGILAGQPVEIRVTALRRAEPEVPVQAEVPPVAVAADPAAEATEGESDSAAAESGVKGTAAVAAAALAEAEAAPTATDPALAGTEAGAAPGTEPVAEAPPKTAKERRAEAKAAREEKRAAAKAAKAAAAAAAAAAEGTVDGAGVAEVETAPLDARAADVSAAADAAAVEGAPKDKAEAPTPAEAPAAEATTEAPAAGTARTIQIASFSQEENANRAVADLAKIGVKAQVRKSEVGGKSVWGILASGDAATLKSIRSAGYPDAYFLQ